MALQFLKSDSDFEAFRQSKTFSKPLLKIRVRYRQDQNLPRFGFIVPKKVVPRVVDRNLIKRRIKSILQKSISNLKNADVVFYPQKDLVKKTFVELNTDIEDLFKQAKLWKS